MLLYSIRHHLSMFLYQLSLNHFALADEFRRAENWLGWRAHGEFGVLTALIAKATDPGE